MSTKIAKNTFPAGKSPSNYKCYGPPATKDTEFAGARIADMGCFTQDEKDSNKYYHVAMCTDDLGTWCVYTEYGRQGAGKPQYQIIVCSSESEAQREFISKCEEKNTKRGKWDTIGGMKMFVPKPGKDMYSVRQLAKRTHGLPDAQAITVTSAAPVVTKTKKSSNRCDKQTTQLLRDLLGGAVSYTRSSLQGGTIPVQSAIDEARQMLNSAKQRVGKIGNVVEDQIKDTDLKQLTYSLYSRIPKIKPLHSPERDWILSQDNIFNWEQDLDAFETALQSGSVEDIEEDDPMQGMPLDMSWIEPNTEIGTWLYDWWPKATRNKHAYLGGMKISGLWMINRHNDDKVFDQELKSFEKLGRTIGDRPLHQDKKRIDLDTNTNKRYWNANVGMLFHGTRSVNVPSILRTNLKLPQQLSGVVITGAMFGDGIYWADDWKKSAGYTSIQNSYWSKGSGAVKGRKAFMFVADVLLGNPHLATQTYGYTKPPTGCDSVFAKGGYSGVANNEWIVYQGGRNVLKYLVEFTC